MIEPVVADVASVTSVELTPPAAVSRPLRAVVPVTARALLPIVAPPSANDVPLPIPILVFVIVQTLQPIISTISLTAQATPRTTDVPLVAV
jgi:hypothetical protein